MNYKIFTLLTLLFVFIIGCKKEKQSTSPSIIGLWEVKLLTITRYDSLNNIIKIDTVQYTNEVGTPVNVFEKYTSDNKFLIFKNSINDTILSSTYSQTGDNIKINEFEDMFPFNNRTITKLDDYNLELFQIFPKGSSKEKWIQKYFRL